MVSFHDLAAALKMDVAELMKQANAKIPPSRALVKGLAKELGIDEGFLEKLAVEVRPDLGAK
jgi:transcriptional regulator with XRE-family HTH domain